MSGKLLTHICLIPARTPGIPQIGRERRARTPQISSSSPRKSLMFEAGVGDLLATLRVSRAEANFQYRITSKSQPRKYTSFTCCWDLGKKSYSKLSGVKPGSRWSEKFEASLKKPPPGSLFGEASSRNLPRGSPPRESRMARKELLDKGCSST